MILSALLLSLTPTLLFQEPVIEKLVEVTDDSPEIHTPTLGQGYTSAPTVGVSTEFVVPSTGDWTFQLRSYFFDAYLVAFDSKGTLLGEDDDGLLGTHAKLVLSLESGERIRLALCALHGERGAGELQIFQGQLPDLEGHFRLEAAIADSRRGLKEVEVLRDPDHPDVGTALENLAGLLHAQGFFAEARVFTERSMFFFEKDFLSVV
ncbi:MAG: tetratricopeptide repeat protein [Planctomycetota bacterium]|nr:tetratricopeptide repeat protein [Planctomycetota bacterium]